MSDRGTSWSVTINNPIPADEENIALARQKGWKVEGQLEKGKEGTPHYQLLVKTPQVRFSAVKKMFPRAHIEKARNVAALENYVHKEETREAQLQTTSDMYPSMQKMWDMFAEWLSDRPLTNGLVAGREDRWLEEFDLFIGQAILDGYVVETMAVNPQIRAVVKKYGWHIICRSNNRRQTDRQTDEESISGSIQNESSSVEEESFS